MTTPTTRRRRCLTIENSHNLHRNPYRKAGNIYMAMIWAHEHHAICPQCRRRFERMNRPEYEQRYIAKRLAQMAAGGAE